MKLQTQRGQSWKVRIGSCGVHLFDRSTGLNVLLNELRLPPTSWSRAPRQVSIALTNACDLSCAHCFAPKHRAALDLETVKRWLFELDQNGCLGVGFGGGEPTLFRGFAELCRYASHSTKLAVTFTTHAHHLSDGLADELTGSVHFVRVSMDGVGATYEAIRGRPFEAFVQRLRTVRRLARFGINFLVNARTLPELDAAIGVATDAGASELLLLPEQRTARTPGIDAVSMITLRGWVERYRGPLPLLISEAGSDGFPTCNPVEREKGLDAYAHIDASGLLKKTSYERSGASVGIGVMAALEQLRHRGMEGRP